jgi:aminoglycoside phosphotransferase (APT) family kinase protein
VLDRAVGTRLLEFLRGEFRDAALGYAEPPVPMLGGFDARIYGFRLEARTEALAKPLVLRVLRESHGAAQAKFEAAVHNGVAELGFPAPRALATCTDTEILGRVFVVMERVPGRNMLDAMFRPGFQRLPAMLARAQAALHGCDATHFRAFVDRCADAARIGTVDRDLQQVEVSIRRASLEGLSSTQRWLVEHKPRESESPVICHGDFHPLNVLVSGRDVTGVVDWSWVHLADPEYDVGATVALFTQGPVEMPAFIRPIIGSIRRGMMRAYLRAYARERSLELDRVSYYEALRCLGFLVEAGEKLQQAAGIVAPDMKPSAFGQPHVRRSIIERLRQLTGTTPSLPDDEPVRRLEH